MTKTELGKGFILRVVYDNGNWGYPPCKDCDCVFWRDETQNNYNHHLGPIGRVMREILQKLL